MLVCGDYIVLSVTLFHNILYAKDSVAHIGGALILCIVSAVGEAQLSQELNWSGIKGGAGMGYAVASECHCVVYGAVVVLFNAVNAVIKAVFLEYLLYGVTSESNVSVVRGIF